MVKLDFSKAKVNGKAFKRNQVVRVTVKNVRDIVGNYMEFNPYTSDTYFEVK